MKKRKFNQDEHIWTLASLRHEISINNSLKARELEIEREFKEKELETKDRVDISVKEYNELKKKNETLESNMDFYKGLYKELKIEPFLSNIEWRTLKTRIWRDLQTNKLKVSINFDVEELL